MTLQSASMRNIVKLTALEELKRGVFSNARRDSRKSEREHKEVEYKEAAILYKGKASNRRLSILTFRYKYGNLVMGLQYILRL